MYSSTWRCTARRPPSRLRLSTAMKSLARYAGTTWLELSLPHPVRFSIRLAAISRSIRRLAFTCPRPRGAAPRSWSSYRSRRYRRSATASSLSAAKTPTARCTMACLRFGRACSAQCPMRDCFSAQKATSVKEFVDLRREDTRRSSRARAAGFAPRVPRALPTHRHRARHLALQWRHHHARLCVDGRSRPHVERGADVAARWGVYRREPGASRARCAERRRIRRKSGRAGQRSEPPERASRRTALPAGSVSAWRCAPVRAPPRGSLPHRVAALLSRLKRWSRYWQGIRLGPVATSSYQTVRWVPLYST